MYLSHSLRLDVIRLKWRIANCEILPEMSLLFWLIVDDPSHIVHKDYILSTFHCHCLHDFRGSIMNEWCMCIFFHRTRADWFITSVLLLHMYGRYVHSIFWIIMNLYQLNHVISNMFAKHIHCNAFFVAPSILSTRSKSNYHFKC